VDGTLIESWASLKSFRPKNDQGPKDGNGWGDFTGEKRTNETHASKTDPEAKLLRKGAGKEAKPCFSGHAVMENRHGFCVSFEPTPAVGVTESEMALEQLKRLQADGFNPTSVGADKGYHNRGFVEGCQGQSIKAHVARVKGRKTSGLDGRTTRSKGYQMSQTRRKRIEEIFGWMKTVGGMRRSRFRGAERTDAACKFVVSALNLLRLAKRSMAPPNVAVRAYARGRSGVPQFRKYLRLGVQNSAKCRLHQHA
jgi:hypothetical protein